MSKMMEIQTITKPLRVCRYCGLEVYTEEDLKQFVKHEQCKYGHDNLCRICLVKRTKEWRKTNPEKAKVLDMHNTSRQINFQGKRIRLKKNPRTNVCLECGRKYPEELKRQTAMHHDFYDPNNLLAGTMELCTSCHTKLHRRRE